MSRDAIARDLRQYIADEILEGKDEGLDEEAPLLEWGIINSIEISKLVARVLRTYGVRMASKDIQPANFETIRALSEFVHSRISADSRIDEGCGSSR
jgi:acyl carrier protein